MTGVAPELTDKPAEVAHELIQRESPRVVALLDYPLSDLRQIQLQLRSDGRATSSVGSGGAHAARAAGFAQCQVGGCSRPPDCFQSRALRVA